jgi:hypothetical protein
MKFYQSCHLFRPRSDFYNKIGTMRRRSEPVRLLRGHILRQRLFPNLWDNVVLFENFHWSQLRDKVSSGPLRERLREAVGKPQRVVDARTSVSKKEARGAYEEILQVVEQLYAENGL